MQLETLQVENFRCFENAKITFAPQYTVLIGTNGAGKSGILDAVSLALGSFLAGMDGVRSNAIQQEDVRFRMFMQGSVATREPQYPVKISAQVNLNNGKPITWSRALNGEKGRTTVREAHPIMTFAQSLQNDVRQGKSGVILPLVAYYGTGRLWNQKQTHRLYGGTDSAVFSRFHGYDDCLTAASNEKIMMQWFAHMTYLRLQEEKEIPELQAVERAIADCYAGVDPAAKQVKARFSVKRNELEISVVHADDSIEYLPLHMLSDGIRTILSMVADIAYRMAVLNPHLLDSILQQTDGIVMIDEIDMHLHPAWQKRILADLTRIFPKIQFIVTTHAPSVLVNVKREHVRILYGNQALLPEEHTYGKDINIVLNDVMGTEVRPEKVLNLIKSFNQAIDDGNPEQAKRYLAEMHAYLGDNDPDVIRAQVALDMESI